ncbi:hypothetical protein KV557_07860 [Kitasatospora aureofaciens]|uniref:hypothetical protein n=1 Tax=Kitasatospora aureofaciens TaxID=1894 RepID=UPI001C4606F2|nr:hypothetical protein [Kitasatospora aureofaciens]MBV6697036.1 hypothetical protein [Kitasatospora aureofaciens]
MSTNRSRRIDRDTAEQLLGGAVGGPSAGQDASLTGSDGTGQLARVLAAAAAPATAAELAGEEAALTAFREARLTPDPVQMTAPVRRRSMATATLARAFSAKAAAAVLGATALCGVAVAAGTGNLSSALDGGPSEPEHSLAPVGTPGTSSAAGTGTASTGTPSGRPSGTGSSATGSSGGGSQALKPSATPSPGASSADGHGTPPASPAVVALCHTFADRTGKGEHPARLVTDPLFGPLVMEAGGPDKVEDYCVAALGRAANDAPRSATPQPHDPGRPGPSADPGGGTGNGTDAGKGNGDGGAGKNGGGGTGDGSGGKPGKGGATGLPLTALPTPPDVHQTKPDNSPPQR